MAKKHCKRCSLFDEVGVDGQAFHNGKLWYDVVKARVIIATKPRKPVVIRPDLAVAALGGIRIEHIAHVNTRYPAIALREKRKLIFIDGNHRVAARLCRRKPVEAYLLTARERRVILSSK